MRSRIRFRKVVFWGAFLLLACLTGVVVFAFYYATDGETLAAVIRAEAPRYLPGARLDLGRVRIHPFVGEVKLSQVHVRQTIDGDSHLALRLPWLQIRLDPRALLKRRFVPREVVVAQPTLRLRRRRDGTWNLQGLFAPHWPGPPMSSPPPVIIQNGTVELADGVPGQVTAILRDVALRIDPAGGERLAFEGSARGDTFDRASLRGWVDLATGQVELSGDLGRLEISETLRGRLPAELRPVVEEVGLTSGEVDLRLAKLSYDPAAGPPLHYDASAQVRAGVWNCPRLPFPINDLSASVSVRDGVVVVERAEGYNGPTTVRVERGRVALGGDPERAPFDLHLSVVDLELDRRLRDRTPPQFAGLWNEFSPRGRISVAIRAVRQVEGGPLAYAWTVDCRDVAMTYKHFKYPLEHVRGRFSFQAPRIKVEELRTLVGGKPLTARGTIENPGPDAHVVLDFQGDAVPIDKALLDAMPPDIRRVVDQFHPTGAVRGTARVERTRRTRPEEPPEGKVQVDAFLELNERCAITWDGLPYPVSNLTGKLELHPDRWIFTEMRGGHGQAVITGSGRVERVAGRRPDQLAVRLDLHAEKLPFDDQLRAALPPAWQKTWATLNPVGSCDMSAKIRVHPDAADDYLLEIDPRPETSVRLEFSRAPRPGIDPGGTFDLRMEAVRGRFVFHNGPVDMNDVSFRFHGSPVKFARGQVVVEDSGRFALGAKQIEASHVRLDQELRKIMPPVMAQFARRLDDGRTFSTIKGDLGLGWSGRAGAPVECGWNNVLVVFNDNTIQAGIPLEHLQGQLDHVRGRSNGESLEVDGALKLESISLLGQQVTALESPIKVADGLASLGNIRGKLLGGTIEGDFQVTLNDTPRYATKLRLQGADLRHYAATLPGLQSFRGLVFGNLSLNGQGNDLHTLQGKGEAHVVQGDLGELPILLRLVKKIKQLNLAPASKTAFDSADVYVTIRDGESLLEPIKLTGNAVSLTGHGTMDIQGNLELRLKPLYGRDRLHVPILSDVVREASGQLFIVRIHGPLAYPQLKVEPLPGVIDLGRSIGTPRGPRADRGAR